MGIKDLTDADLKKINDKLKNAGSELYLTPKLAKDINEILPKGLKLELDPKLNAVSNEALQKAVEGKVMKVEIAPLVTSLRKALRDATKDNPPEMEVGVQSAKLRKLIETVLNKQGFLINISTVNDNYTKVVQQKLNGTRYTVKIHADAKEITQSVQASLMQVQSRYFGLRVSRDILYRSIDEALGTHRFPINIVVQQDQAHKAVQDALLRAQAMGKDQALAYQRMQTGELKAAQAELARLKAAQMGAASAAKAHATASIDLGGAMGSNIKIAGELGSAMASLYSIHAAKEFLSQVIEIGGELEHQKIAMDTIFGDKGKTNELFGQIKGLARQSPFGVMELTKSVKALSAYGVEYNEIYDTAKRLADISAATSVDINRLILAFGKTKSRTFLDGLEAKQFAYANIPIYDLLSKKLTELEGRFVSIGEVMERQKKREIGFDIVKDVLWDITDPGGKFYNMQEALAGSVKTSWKLVRDNIELMFGEIAESDVGDVLKEVATILQKLTRNWKLTGNVIAGVAAAYGVYKLAVLASNAVMGTAYAETIKNTSALKGKEAQIARTALQYRRLTIAEIQSVIQTNALSRANKNALFTRQKLTMGEMSALYQSKALTRDMALRLAATGRLERGTLSLLRAQKLISYSDMRYLAQLRSGTTILGLHGKAVSALAMRFKLLGASIQSAFSSIGAMLLSPVTAAMAAIGAGMYVWEKDAAEKRAAEQFGKDFQARGEEAARNIGEALKRNATVSGHEAEQLLEEYKNLIKDYSSTPDNILDNALFDDNGNIRNTAEQIAYLRKELEGLKDVAEKMAEGGVDGIVKATNSGFGFLDDDIITDMKDWEASARDAEASYLRFVSQNKELAKQMVEAASNADSSYASTINHMGTLSEKFNELMKNREKYSAGYEAAQAISGGKLDDYTGKWMMDVGLKANFVTSALEEFTGAYTKLRQLLGIKSVAEESNIVESDWREMKAEIQEAVDAFKTETEDWDYDNLKPAQVEYARKFWNGIIEQAGVTAPAAKAEIQKMISDVVGIDIQGLNGRELVAEEIKQGGDRYLSKELVAKLEAGLEVTSEEQKQIDDAIIEAYNTLFNNAKRNHDKWMQEALNAAVAEDGKFSHKNFLQIQARLDLTADWDEWQREVNQRLQGNTEAKVWIKGSSDVLSFVDAAQKGYATAQTTINKLKPLMLKAGIGFEGGKKIPIITEEYKNLTPTAKRLVDDYNRAIESIEAATLAGREYGFDAAAEYNRKNKTKGTQKDKFAESLKQRFKDIKDAWSEFQKWSKTEGREAAAQRVGDSGLFSTLSADKIPQTIEDYRALVKGLEDELRQAGVKGTARESLLNDLLKQLLDIDKTVVDEQLKLALDKVSKEAERQLADWNLFDKIRKATGNEELAMSIGFGLNTTAETDYPKLIEQQLDKQAKAYEDALVKKTKGTKNEYTAQGYTYQSLKDLYDKATAEGASDEDIEAWKAVPQTIRDAWEKANGDILKYFDQQREAAANILNEYQTLQDKIDAINAKRKTNIEVVEGKNKKGEYNIADENERKRLIGLINSKADWDIFRQGNDYLRFFSTIYSYTLSEAQNMGMLIEQYLNQQLQDAQISAEEYGKEMERIRQQIEKLRNVKSPFRSILTDGVGGYLNQQQNILDDKIKADPKLSKELFDYRKREQELTEQIAQAQRDGDKDRYEALKKELQLLKDGLSDVVKSFNLSEKLSKILGDVNGVMGGINNIAQGVSDAFNSIKDMADAYGFDTESDTWLNIGAVVDTFSQVSGALQAATKGDIGGIISGTIGAITAPFTIWSKLHDKKLQKRIDRSKEAAQIMQNQYDILEKQMANFLGNAAAMNTGVEGGAYGKQRQLMQGQLAELQKQRQAEADKKKSDDSVLTDYDRQIQELQISIRDFALEAAKDLYGIDLNGWAQQLGDSLVDAFAKGEDAAKAFDSTVGDIMRDVTSKMISQDILAPMFGDLRRFLFGEDGTSGAFGSDFTLSPEDAAKMQEYIARIKNKGIPAAQELYDAIDSATGGLLSDSSASDSLREGIEGIKEDQADMLASYLNAVRADVSIQTTVHWPRLLDESLPQISVIAQSQLDCQRRIAEYARRNAEAAEAIVESNDKISRLLVRVTQGGEKFHIQ